MRRVDTFDYLRLRELGRRSLTLDIPPELVPRKRRSRVSAARARRSEQRFAKAAAEHFRSQRRKAFRAEVAAHILLRGVPLPEAYRVVKALLDGLKGVAFADDRAVGLLDISPVLPLESTQPSAEVHLCPLRLYADAFDIFSGAHDDDEDDYDSALFLPREREDPWRANSVGADRELDMDTARENLEATREADYLPDDLRADLIRYDEERLRRYELDVALDHPYQADERPGELNIMGRLWRDFDLRSSWAIQIPAPRSGDGSWTAIATDAIKNHFAKHAYLAAVLPGEEVALDVAVCQGAAPFDLDNLAVRVLRAWQRGIPGGPVPESIRVYRRVGDGGRVDVRMRSPERARGLRQLFTVPRPLEFDFAPDDDATVHRARPKLDQEMWKGMRALDEEIRRHSGTDRPG